MDQRTNQIFFALLRSAICDQQLTRKEQKYYDPNCVRELLALSSKHDIVHLLALGLKNNQLISQGNMGLEKCILNAVFRYERIKFELDNLCNALEQAQIPFIPLKGSVLRKYYPEPWMRTSCDIDILVHPEDLDKAIAYLTECLKYTEKERATHDASLFSPMGIHLELHFDLVEEGRANNAISVLRSVWKNVSLHEKYQYWYEMTDAFFYFYHIAHMAKHFETGGCGIRPFIDLWILDQVAAEEKDKRDELLAKGELLVFTNACRALNQVWFGGNALDERTSQMQEFLLHGGAYGSADNRVALQQNRKGGRWGYILSRIFVPYERLVRYYPILEKHRWLMPFMQVRRWFMLLRPDVAKMAKTEINTNNNLSKSKARQMKSFLDSIGL